jgi:hypothetical protein
VFSFFPLGQGSRMVGEGGKKKISLDE